MALTKTLIHTIALALALSLGSISTSFATPTQSLNQPSNPLSEYQKSPSFLFVLQAKSATVTPVNEKDGTYTITMALTDDNLQNIIAFSDRPYRIVKYITAEQLKDIAYQGINSFKTDPPNAVFSGDGVSAQIIIIESYMIKKGNLVLGIRSTENLNEGEVKETVVVIDECGPHNRGLKIGDSCLS